MADRMTLHGLQVNTRLASFVEDRALPGTGIAPDAFRAGLSALVHGLGPENRALPVRRDDLQAQIDAWHVAHRARLHDHEASKAFLQEIGYLLPEGPEFQSDTGTADPEIALMPGPQLVVPITNARYALNSANACWGSLFDALYGTDAMGSAPPKGGNDRGRGARVVARVRMFLDDAFPIAGGSHADVRRCHVHNGALLIDAMPLMSPETLAGCRGHPKAPDAVVLANNGLHVELVFDHTHPIGSRNQAGLADVPLESAISAIMDCEDSVACVDAEDKVLAYGTWLGLMTGTLEAHGEKGGRTIRRKLSEDGSCTAPDGGVVMLNGRADAGVQRGPSDDQPGDPRPGRQ
jgi:malate synthase